MPVGISRLSVSKSGLKISLMSLANVADTEGFIFPGLDKPHMTHNFFKLSSCVAAALA